MIAIDHLLVQNLIKEFQSSIDEHWEDIEPRLETLRDEYNGAKRLYVQAILNKGSKIITASLAEIPSLKTSFDDILAINNSNRQHRKFKNRVIAALGYAGLRSTFYPKYFQKLGLKACVYCNSQLCVTVVKHNRSLSARFQVDHFASKSRYPCLSITLFNLYPVCASCNNIKGEKQVPFQLYSENPTDSEYSFSLKDPDVTVASYLTDRDPKHIKISFLEPKAIDGSYPMNHTFSIEGIYNTQIDIVEELLLKAHIYNDTYREELSRNFSSILPDKQLLFRLLLGHYPEAAEMHNRPLSKFVQDISKQLRLI